eukprot:641040_1
MWRSVRQSVEGFFRIFGSFQTDSWAANQSGERIFSLTGGGSANEVVAYQISKELFNGSPNVPRTEWKSFHGQRGSSQKFVQNLKECESGNAQPFSAKSFQFFAIFDISLDAQDRTTYNLVHVGTVLVAIDNGLILPPYTDLGCAEFDWKDWFLAKTKIVPEVKEFVAQLDISAGVKILRRNKVAEDRILTFKLSTNFLKIAVNLDFSVSQIAYMMIELKSVFDKPRTLEEKPIFEQLVTLSSQNGSIPNLDRFKRLSNRVLHALKLFLDEFPQRFLKRITQGPLLAAFLEANGLRLDEPVDLEIFTRVLA